MRYLPIFAGLILATAFSLSVLYDGGDVARAAWMTGDELLGMFGGFGLVALPAIFVASAFARRGIARGVVRLTRHARAIDLALEDGRVVHVPLSRVRSGFMDELDDGRSRVSLELAGGVTDGDRIVLEVDRETAASFADVIGAAPRFTLGPEGWTTGALLSLASIATGSAIGAAVFARVERVMETIGGTSVDGHGFEIGLMVAAVGVVRALVAAATSAPDLVVGIDGVRIEGALRKRFIPFASIEKASRDAFGLALELTDGERIRLSSSAIDADRARTILALIAERSGDTSPDSPRVAGPRHGSIGAWREAIQEAISGAGYRGGTVSNEALARSLGTPGLSSEERVATAIALLARGEEPSRIRIAACGVAEDSTRAALERLAEGEADDAALEALLLVRQR